MRCHYHFQGARTCDGKPPGGCSKKRYWRRLAHLLDHENFHYQEDLKAAKADAKKKCTLIKNLMEVVDTFHNEGRRMIK
ncbi:hypothetical protein AAVH_38979, partial [Aphelenchoides avenae]